MIRRRLPVLLLLAACASIPANRYGLRVVPDVATYERLVRADPGKRLVDVESLGIAIDVRYATANNFMKAPLYPIAKAYVRAPAARALAEIQRELAKEGLALKVFDGYRPYSITEQMWERIHQEGFVANP
ncbi:MAG TPA: M15 family metallopeptidase, partial [Thermoanaerobaculia bacterium]|nr:M15 family metallopeptidase [Thermoanaerobaculia bacterium]